MNLPDLIPSPLQFTLHAAVVLIFLQQYHNYFQIKEMFELYNTQSSH
jgi:hypothetical protein